MNFFISALLGGLVQVAGSLVGRVLLSLGIGYVVYSGVDAALSSVKAAAFAQLASASSVVPQIERFIGVFQVGTCFNILFSAWASRLVLAGISGGSLKRMVLK